MSVNRSPVDLFTAILLCAGAPRGADACDRACLQGFVEQYMTALAAHAPAAIPLNKGHGTRRTAG